MQVLQALPGLTIRNARLEKRRQTSSTSPLLFDGETISTRVQQYPGSIHEEVFAKARALSSSPVTLKAHVEDESNETPREARLRHYAHSSGRVDIATFSERGGIQVEARPSPFSLVESSTTRTMLHPPRLVPVRVVSHSKGNDFEPFERSGFLHALVKSEDNTFEENSSTRELYSRSGHTFQNRRSRDESSPIYSSSSSALSSSPLSPLTFSGSSRSSPTKLRESPMNIHDEGETLFSNRLCLGSDLIEKIESIRKVFAPYLFADKVGTLCHFNNEPNIELSIRVWTIASEVFTEATQSSGVSLLLTPDFDIYARNVAKSLCALVNGTFHSLSRIDVKSTHVNAQTQGLSPPLRLWKPEKVESRFHSAVHSSEFELKSLLNSARSVLEKATHLVRLEEEKERELKAYRVTGSPIHFSNSVFIDPLESQGTRVGLRFDPLKRELPPSIRLSALTREEDSTYQSPSSTFRQNMPSSGFTKPVDLTHVTASLASTLDSISSGTLSPLTLPPCVVAQKEKGIVHKSTLLGTKTSPRLMVLSDEGTWKQGQRQTKLVLSTDDVRPRGGSPLFSSSSSSSSSSSNNMKIMSASLRETLAPPGTISPSFYNSIRSLSSSLTSSPRPEVKHLMNNFAASNLSRVLM